MSVLQKICGSRSDYNNLKFVGITENEEFNDDIM